ncbi:hypothetical protein [Methylovirgula sp. 4M-Z18]|uniref:hypothetical protein n=1 Tax=Methylovirgula sp. 4M-Z18 TaxID=2293567 RepID=UPI000E2EF93C|nr:hypothetical protein [Methylovirgula sp. 4M-Z18]RFB78237.1 hypothetical protein DYH55_17880 [Methylovirgula sp. 4M-Z18]
MRAIKKALWLATALIFLGLSWLWDHLHPIIGWFIAILPLEGLKRRVAAFMETLPPYPTLLIFLIPLLLPEIFKIAAIWLAAHHHWLFAGGVYLFAEIVRYGLIAYLFTMCRDKLLSIGWFKTLYEWVMKAHAWAHEQTAPIKAWIKTALQYEGLTNSHHHSLWRRLVALWRYTRTRRA